MMQIGKLVGKNIAISKRIPKTCLFSTTTSHHAASTPRNHYSLVIIGGGAGGISVAARFARTLKTPRSIALIEPQTTHYYQPLWTLVGAGLKRVEESAREMARVIPPNVDWIRNRCVEIDPGNSSIRIESGSSTTAIKYDYLVVSAGIQLDWNKIEGLTDALESDPAVCSNYSVVTAPKTFDAMRRLKSGNALFTYPNTPIKCGGAPQKIMYLTDAFLRKNGLRSKVHLEYHTALPVLFVSKHYADALWNVCAKRDLQVKTQSNLIQIDPLKKSAYFQPLDRPNEAPVELPYEMLHVTPPMSAPKFLESLATATSNGFVAVDPKTLQHVKFGNIFALGDCSSLPTSKTAAAIASQNYILARNLVSFMHDPAASLPESYDGYTSCPLVTGFSRCIMAEFDYTQAPLETLPFDQSKERISSYLLKRDALPALYWNAMLKGHWKGPAVLRKLAHLGLGK